MGQSWGGGNRTGKKSRLRDGTMNERQLKKKGAGGDGVHRLIVGDGMGGRNLIPDGSGVAQGKKNKKDSATHGSSRNNQGDRLKDAQNFLQTQHENSRLRKWGQQGRERRVTSRSNK